MTDLLKPILSAEVADALAEKRPLVALESTIISHGMPYPDNLAMARRVEDTVRQHGATPATIAVVDGELRVGLDEPSLERLANGRDVVKAASQDLAAAIVLKRTAGTTVSATMRLAELSGIGVFATGGIGGVHRGAESTFDISADLTELGRTPTAVVCAGVKSILDIPKTLEYLETQRVPVIAYGTDEFPAFFARRSGSTVHLRFDRIEDIAAQLHTHRRLGSGTGVLIANPIPEQDALAPEMIDAIIADALRDAGTAGIAGKDVTPFLLARINELTGGVSLRANIALVLNNAAVAAQIAVASTKLN